MTMTRSLRWSEVPGFTDLDDEIHFGFGDDWTLEPFILMGDTGNSMNISTYVSRELGLVMVYYDGGSEIRFIRNIPDTENNRRYLIQKLSDNGSVDGMDIEF